MKILRPVAGIATVLFPLLLFMNISDGLSHFLLPESVFSLFEQFQNITLANPTEFVIADWAGRISFSGFSVFLVTLSILVAGFSLFVIYSTLNGTLMRTMSTCALAFLLAVLLGFRFGWNGPAPALNLACKQSPAIQQPTKTIDVENQGFWKAFDGFANAVMKVTFTTPADQKSGADILREQAISMLYCEIEKSNAFLTEDRFQRSVAAWNLLNFNTILIYTVSVLVFLSLGFLVLDDALSSLIDRGRKLKLLLMSLAVLLSVGIAQLRSYFNWPASLLDEKTRKAVVALSDSSANYLGLAGSATLFVTFVLPLVWWQYDLGRAMRLNPSNAGLAAAEFKLSNVVAFAAIAAAPALSSPLVKLLSGA